MSVLDHRTDGDDGVTIDLGLAASDEIAALAYRAIAGGLDVLDQDLLGVAGLARTQLVLAAVTCRSRSHAEDPGNIWRLAAIALENAARSERFALPEDDDWTGERPDGTEGGEDHFLTW
jgi:hypothetical protein